jgi:hypothetical protein
VYANDWLIWRVANSVNWPPFDNAAKAKQENLLTNVYDEALRALAPDMGAYMNEVSSSSLRFLFASVSRLLPSYHHLASLHTIYLPPARQVATDEKKADPNEPNFQHAFWGTNYPRLLEIKRRVDPCDVLWCTPCVGNERWKEVGDSLCRV